MPYRSSGSYNSPFLSPSLPPSLQLRCYKTLLSGAHPTAGIGQQLWPDQAGEKGREPQWALCDICEPTLFPPSPHFLSASIPSELCGVQVTMLLFLSFFHWHLTEITCTIFLSRQPFCCWSLRKLMLKFRGIYLCSICVTFIIIRSALRRSHKIVESCLDFSAFGSGGARWQYQRKGGSLVVRDAF